jgi:hypothetical protein
MNKIHTELQFQATDENNNTISFQDLLITRETTKLSINIYRKPTTTDSTIHFKSNHPIQHKMAAYRYMLNRLHNLPLTREHKKQKMNTITQIAIQNGYPITLIERLNNRIKAKINSTIDDTQIQPNNNKKMDHF